MASNKNTSQNKHNKARKQEESAQKAAADEAAGKTPEAAMERFNAPAQRLTSPPPAGLMASGLRAYQPQSMPDAGRPNGGLPSNRFTDPNDAYGWGGRGTGVGYYSEVNKDRLAPGEQPYDSYLPDKPGEQESTNTSKVPGFFGEHNPDKAPRPPPKQRSIYDSDAIWADTDIVQSPSPAQSTGPTNRAGVPSPAQTPSPAQGANTFQPPRFGGRQGAPSWLEQARSSSGMGGGGGYSPRQGSPALGSNPMFAGAPTPGMSEGGGRSPNVFSGGIQPRAQTMQPQQRTPGMAAGGMSKPHAPLPQPTPAPQQPMQPRPTPGMAAGGVQPSQAPQRRSQEDFDRMARSRSIGIGGGGGMLSGRGAWQQQSAAAALRGN